VIATLLTLGAMSLLAEILVPLFLAMVLSVAFSPVAGRLERKGVPRTLASLICLAAVVAVLVTVVGLVVRQSASVFQQVQRSMERLGRDLDKLALGTDTGRLIRALGMGGAWSPGRRGSPPRAGGSQGQDFWAEFVINSGQTLGRWVVGGLGGLLGFLGGVAIMLAFFFYLLYDRDRWIARVLRAARALRLRLCPGDLEQIRQRMVRYVGCLALVTSCYGAVIALVMWLIGLPQPLFCGALTGVLELVPYFGPAIAGALPTAVAATMGDGWWRPAAVAGSFILLQTIEGYVVAPLVYGRAVEIDPVTVMFGVLLMGWLWGPLGLACAMPMLILLRGLLSAGMDVPSDKAIGALECP
jgi:predicted PurR-regulated permease PerM